MRLKNWTCPDIPAKDCTLGNLGNQDRSLSADAVQAAGTVIINKVAVGGDDTFNYTGTGSGISANFSITTVGGTGSQTFNDIIAGANRNQSAPLQAGLSPASSVAIPAMALPPVVKLLTLILTPARPSPVLTLTQSRDNHRRKQTEPDTAAGSFTFTGTRRNHL
jgi:hypothetical protein